MCEDVISNRIFTACIWRMGKVMFSIWGGNPGPVMGYPPLSNDGVPLPHSEMGYSLSRNGYPLARDGVPSHPEIGCSPVQEWGTPLSSDDVPLPHPEMGYPPIQRWVPPGQRWGPPLPWPEMGYPPVQRWATPAGDGGTPPPWDRTAERALATRWAVCLLRSRRNTILYWVMWPWKTDRCTELKKLFAIIHCLILHTVPLCLKYLEQKAK